MQTCDWRMLQPTKAVPHGLVTLPTVIVGLFISHINPILRLDVFHSAVKVQEVGFGRLWDFRRRAGDRRRSRIQECQHPPETV
jgi:hypothetical protein